MKKKIIFITFFLSQFSFASPIDLKIEDVVTNITERNYLVYENALKVYQSKKDIERARGELLPRLNVWNIASIIIEPWSILDSIGEVAPYLVPANWFRLEEIKLLYLSEKEGYRALWGNELHSAKVLFFHALFDQQLLEHIKTSIKELTDIHLIVRTREQLGGAPPGTARDVEIRILGLKEDEKNLTQLLREELNSLSYSLAFPANTIINLKPVAIPDIVNLPPIEYDRYEFQLLANSPERRQFAHLLSALKQIKKELMYSVLGGSDISRGVAGGIFDNLPTSNGVSLGTAPAVKIVEAQGEILLMQRKGVEETLRRQLLNLSELFNSDILFYKNVSRRVDLAKESKKQILRRVKLGEEVSMLELAEASRNLIQAETAKYALQFRILASLDRFDRLMFKNDYSLRPPLIESIERGQP